MQETHLWDPFFVPLANTFANTDHTLYSPIQCLLYVLQRRNDGNVWDGKGHIDFEDRLLAIAPPAFGWVILT